MRDRAKKCLSEVLMSSVVVEEAQEGLLRSALVVLMCEGTGGSREQLRLTIMIDHRSQQSFSFAEDCSWAEEFRYVCLNKIAYVKQFCLLTSHEMYFFVNLL